MGQSKFTQCVVKKIEQGMSSKAAMDACREEEKIAADKRANLKQSNKAEVTQAIMKRRRKNRKR